MILDGGVFIDIGSQQQVRQVRLIRNVFTELHWVRSPASSYNPHPEDQVRRGA